MRRIKTYCRISRADKHGQGGGKLLEARYMDIPDEVQHHIDAEIKYLSAKNEIGREAVKASAKKLFGIDMDNPRVALPWR